MKILVVDLETSGLNPIKHEILEIGAVLFDDASFDILGTLDMKVRPKHIDTAEPEALKINGYTEKDWKNAYRLGSAISSLMELGEDAIFCAFPLLFDYSFISSIGVQESFFRHKLDLMSMAYAKLPYKFLTLERLCKHLDITPEPAVHRALNGAMCEYEVFKKLMA